MSPITSVLYKYVYKDAPLGKDQIVLATLYSGYGHAITVCKLCFISVKYSTRHSLHVFSELRLPLTLM